MLVVGEVWMNRMKPLMLAAVAAILAGCAVFPRYPVGQAAAVGGVTGAAVGGAVGGLAGGVAAVPAAKLGAGIGAAAGAGTSAA